MFENLLNSPLFHGVEGAEITALLGKLFYQVKKYEKNEMLVLAGDECYNLLIILKGSVKGEMIDFSGKTIKIEDIAAPRPLAPAFLFGKNNHYPVNIVANELVEVLVLPRDSVLKLMQSNTIFLKNYLNVISSRAQFLSKKIKFLSFNTIKEKIAFFLLQAKQDTDDLVHLTQTQQELADLFGVTRPSLARGMSELEKEGVIEVNRKEVTIKNKIALNNYIRQV